MGFEYLLEWSPWIAKWAPWLAIGGGLLATIAPRFRTNSTRNRLSIYGGLLALAAGAASLYFDEEAQARRNADLRDIVYTDISFACHGWRNAYIYMLGDYYANPKRAEIVKANPDWDTWEVLQKFSEYEYSKETWRYFLPLFDEAANTVREEFNEIQNSAGDVLSPELKALLRRSRLTIKGEQSAYRYLPSMVLLLKTPEDRDRSFSSRFKAMIVLLKEVAQEAERLRDENKKYLRQE